MCRHKCLKKNKFSTKNLLFCCLPLLRLNLNIKPGSTTQPRNSPSQHNPSPNPSTTLTYHPAIRNYLRKSRRLRFGILTSLRLRNGTHYHPNPPHLTLSSEGETDTLNLKPFQAEHFRLESCLDLGGTLEGLLSARFLQNQPCRIIFRVHLGVHEGP